MYILINKKMNGKIRFQRAYSQILSKRTFLSTYSKLRHVVFALCWMGTRNKMHQRLKKDGRLRSKGVKKWNLGALGKGLWFLIKLKCPMYCNQCTFCLAFFYNAGYFDLGCAYHLYIDLLVRECTEQLFSYPTV